MGTDFQTVVVALAGIFVVGIVIVASITAMVLGVYFKAKVEDGSGSVEVSPDA